MKEVCEFLKKCQTYYISSIDGDKPKVRPFGVAEIFEDKLYIQTGKKKDFYKQIEKNPNVEICCFDGQKWLRLAGNLVNDDRVEAKKAVLDAYPMLRGMYDENDDNTAVLYFEHAVATFSSFTEASKKVEW